MPETVSVEVSMTTVIVTCRYPDSMAFIGPSKETKQYRQPCGTLLDTIGTVIGVDKVTYYVVRNVSGKPLYVPADQACLVTEF